MSDNTANVYEAPEANLTENNDGSNKPILNFDRFSAWGVFFLSIITLGIYSVYWLVNRTNKANSLAKNQIAQGLVYGYVALYVVNLVLSIAGILPELGFIVSLASFVVAIILIFSLRTSLTELINEGSAEPVKLNGILTFFFNVIYFQYKINEAIDRQQ
jgi:magnesium-transporting ATPase (P-type)